MCKPFKTEVEVLMAAEDDVTQKNCVAFLDIPLHPDQATLKSVYEYQQSPEGRNAIELHNALAEQFAKITGKRPNKIAMIRPLVNGKTGAIDRYYIER